MDSLPLRACACCGLVQRAPHPRPGWDVRCKRCRWILARAGSRRSGNRLARAAALAALLLYPAALSLPVLRIERLGHHREASIWSGAVSLLSHGQILVGVVVFGCSVIIPLAKLLGLLSITGRSGWLPVSHRAATYRVIEWAGRWGMIDVLLVALLVAFLKLGDVVEVTAGPGVVAFTACVLLSLVASAAFDPHALWEGER